MVSDKITLALGGDSISVFGPASSTDVTVLPNWVSDQAESLDRWSYRGTDTHVEQWSMNLSYLPKQQWLDLSDFFYKVVRGPTLSFTYTHTDGRAYSARFIDGQLSAKRASSQLWSTTIRLELIGQQVNGTSTSTTSTSTTIGTTTTTTTSSTTSTTTTPRPTTTTTTTTTPTTTTTTTTTTTPTTTTTTSTTPTTTTTTTTTTPTTTTTTSTTPTTTTTTTTTTTSTSSSSSTTSTTTTPITCQCGYIIYQAGGDGWYQIGGGCTDGGAPLYPTQSYTDVPYGTVVNVCCNCVGSSTTTSTTTTPSGDPGTTTTGDPGTSTTTTTTTTTTTSSSSSSTTSTTTSTGGGCSGYCYYDAKSDLTGWTLNPGSTTCSVGCSPCVTDNATLIEMFGYPTSPSSYVEYICGTGGPCSGNCDYATNGFQWILLGSSSCPGGCGCITNEATLEGILGPPPPGDGTTMAAQVGCVSS